MLKQVIDILTAVDRALFRAINSISGQPWLDTLMETFSDWPIWVALVLVWVVLPQKKFTYHFKLRTVFFSSACLGVADFVSFNIVKPLVGRDRPCWALEQVKILNDHCGGSYGFSSNHAANSLAFAWAFSYFAPQYRPLLMVLALLIGFSRIYLGVHYPSDVAAGYLLGAGVAVLFIFVYSRILGRNLR